MSAKQIAQIEKDLSLASAEIDRLVKELASVKGNSKSAPAAKPKKTTASPAPKKAVKPAPIKAKAQPKKAPAKKAPAPKKAAPANSTKQSQGKLVGDFNDTAYLQEILKLAQELGSWTGVITALNANGYVTVQGNPIPMNNFTRDLGRRLTNKNAEIQQLAEQIFALLKK